MNLEDYIGSEFIDNELRDVEDWGGEGGEVWGGEGGDDLMDLVEEEGDTIGVELTEEEYQREIEKMKHGRRTLNARFKRMIPNRDYPLTYIELVKSIIIRAKSLERMMGVPIPMPREVDEELKKLFLEYETPGITSDHQLEIKTKIKDLREPVYKNSRKKIRDMTALTDEELQTELHKIPSSLEFFHPIRIAMLEAHFKKLPILVHRFFPDGTDQLKDVNEINKMSGNMLLEASNLEHNLPDFPLDEAF